ncbi:MAG: oxidoreductase family protein, partial [Bacteroidota bacterium]
AKSNPSLIAPTLLEKYLQFLDSFDHHLNTMSGFHKTLIHNDFNTRNICLKSENGSMNLVAYDWELSAFHNPQRDLIEFLCSVMPQNSSKDDFDRYVKVYFKKLREITGIDIPESEFLKVLKLNAYEYALVRLNLYLLVRNLMNLDFIEPLYKNLIRFGIED